MSYVPQGWTPSRLSKFISEEIGCSRCPWHDFSEVEKLSNEESQFRVIMANGSELTIVVKRTRKKSS